MSTATRAQVYAAIDSERDYQDAGKGNAETDRTQTTIAEGLVLLSTYTARALTAFSGVHPAGRDEALNVIRKVAAIAVQTLEHNGAPQREGFERTAAAA